MDLLANYLTLGVLAFIFSATSPEDDAIQQDCYRSVKSTQCALANYRTVSNLRTFRICTVHSAPAAPMQQFASYVTERFFFVPDDEIKGVVFSSKTGDRSPPTKSSYEPPRISSNRAILGECTSGAKGVTGWVKYFISHQLRTVGTHQRLYSENVRATSLRPLVPRFPQVTPEGRVFCWKL